MITEALLGSAMQAEIAKLRSELASANTELAEANRELEEAQNTQSISFENYAILKEIEDQRDKYASEIADLRAQLEARDKP